jgi:Domain of Unknown Function (DUF928)
MFLPATILLGVHLVCSSHPMLAEPTSYFAQKPAQSAAYKQRKFVPPQLPPGLSAPGRRSSAGSRAPGTISASEIVIAIVPEFEQVVDFLPIPQVWVLTSTPHPTFWFHVPRSSIGKTLDFRVEGASRITVYRQSILISQAGLLAIKLPTSFSGLESKKLYRWSLTIQNFSSNPIDGWVEMRVLPSQVQQQLLSASSDKVVDLYTQNGFWLDGFTALATLYKQKPNIYRAVWQDFLAEIGLEKLAANSL